MLLTHHLYPLLDYKVLTLLLIWVKLMLKDCDSSMCVCFFLFFLSLTPKGMSPAALSPALQRLVNRSSRKYTDKALRASYTPSPSHRASGSKTPLSPSHSLHTPTPGKTRTPASHDPASITDNLLQLPKRRTASDFFWGHHWGHKGHQTHKLSPALHFWSLFAKIYSL